MASSQPRCVYGSYTAPRRSLSTSRHQTDPEHHKTHYTQHPRTKYGSYLDEHPIPHEPSPSNNHNGNARRRIQVACTRCRRRKIRCSGDPGDGTGCQACRSTTEEISRSCNFIRVGSEDVGFSVPVHRSPSIADYHLGYASSEPVYGQSMNHTQPAIPVLHTRATFPLLELSSYHGAYNSAGTPTTFNGDSRQDSIAGVYRPSGIDSSHRSWIDAATSTMLFPTVTGLYDASGGYDIGSPQAPFTTPMSHAHTASIAAGKFTSPLDMGSLQCSLPAHATHQRSLPAPQSRASSRELPLSPTIDARLHPSISHNNLPQLAQSHGVRGPQTMSLIDGSPGKQTSLASLDGVARNGDSTTARAASHHRVSTPAADAAAGSQHSIINNADFQNSSNLLRGSRPSISGNYLSIQSEALRHHNDEEEVRCLYSPSMSMTSHEQPRQEVNLYSYSL